MVAITPLQGPHPMPAAPRLPSFSSKKRCDPAPPAAAPAPTTVRLTRPDAGGNSTRAGSPARRHEHRFSMLRNCLSFDPHAPSTPGPGCSSLVNSGASELAGNHGRRSRECRDEQSRRCSGIGLGAGGCARGCALRAAEGAPRCARIASPSCGDDRRRRRRAVGIRAQGAARKRRAGPGHGKPRHQRDPSRVQGNRFFRSIR